MTDKKHKVLPERMNKVGGQAVLEGVMMKGGENVALAVRSEDGTIKLDTKKHVSVRKKYKICRIPVIRDVYKRQLESAGEKLRADVMPRIIKGASERFSAATLGRYSSLGVAHDFSMSYRCV